MTAVLTEETVAAVSARPPRPAVGATAPTAVPPP